MPIVHTKKAPRKTGCLLQIKDQKRVQLARQLRDKHQRKHGNHPFHLQQGEWRDFYPHQALIKYRTSTPSWCQRNLSRDCGPSSLLGKKRHPPPQCVSGDHVGSLAFYPHRAVTGASYLSPLRQCNKMFWGIIAWW